MKPANNPNEANEPIERVTRPVEKQRSPSELLSQIRPEQFHSEVLWGNPKGKEFW